MKLSARAGFTLVELLIVMIVIGILAGMLFMAVGAAPDRAEATRIISNIGNIKHACFLYYANHSAWPQPGNPSGWVVSLDRFLDRPLNMEGVELDIKIISGRYLIGFASTLPTVPLSQLGVQRIFEKQSRESALLDEYGMPYTAGVGKIYMSMR